MPTQQNVARQKWLHKEITLTDMTPEEAAKQIETLEGLNQSLILDYVWDRYEDDCLERALEYNDSYNDDDYSGDRD